MQMALRQKQLDFIYNIASTSITPSMCSGHSLMGVMCEGGTLELLLDRGVTFNRDQAITHAQWSVDIGDRRVMAGVHYPSDNICSWIIFLLAAQFLFHRPIVALLMGYAIRNLSFVYKTIVDYAVKEHSGYVYRDALAALNSYLPPKELTIEDILKDPSPWQPYQP